MAVNLEKTYYLKLSDHLGRVSPVRKEIGVPKIALAGPGNNLVVLSSDSKCPFGFHGDAMREERKLQQDRIVNETLNAPVRMSKLDTSPYAPAPSTNPNGPLPIGPGNFEYLPLKVPYKMMIGLEPIAEDAWIEMDMFYKEEMALRREILNTRREVCLVTTPGVEDACWECLEKLTNYLPKYFPESFQFEGSILSNLITGEKWDTDDKELDPLEVWARLVQEDLCILMEVDGVIRLLAAAVLFPMRWQLLEKMGMDMRNIHKPIPLYEKELGKSADGFMKRLKVGKLWARSNWAIGDDPTLFQPLNEEDIYAALAGKVKIVDDPITLENAGHRLFTRSERQTLSRLPRSKAILFTIRTYVKPLRVFDKRPQLAQSLVDAIDALPTSMVDYKTMRACKDVARAYLEGCAQRK